MRTSTYLRRSLAHHRRSHVAVVLGVAVGTAVVTGALLVGDSMRASLRQTAVDRLAGVSHALSAPRFFRAELATEIASEPGFSERFDSATSAIILRGGVTHADSRTRVEGVHVIALPDIAVPRRRVFLNDALARDLGAKPGDDILLRLGSADPVSNETLMGRRDESVVKRRLTVDDIVGSTTLPRADFALQPGHQTPRNIFVAVTDLQRALDQPGRANVILVSSGDTPAPDSTGWLTDRLRARARLADYGLRTRSDVDRGYFVIESEAFLIDPAIEEAAARVAGSGHFAIGRVLTYLANEIAAVDRQSAGIPYSTVSAIDAAELQGAGLTLVDGNPAPMLQPGDLLLNKWAAGALEVSMGETIRLSFYVTGTLGTLIEQAASFKLTGIVALTGGAADPGFTPPYEGVTDTDNLADWDPPFPVHLDRVTDRDEAYWDEHGTTPKAFISLDDGRRLWAEKGDRFGRLTGIRVRVAEGADPERSRAAFEQALLAELDPALLGLRFDPVRAQALLSGKGSTDFGGLFIGFSFFLILSAAMLVALLFRLGIERRAAEVGTLLALGFSPRRVARLLLTEGVMLAVVGGAIGLPAATGYAWLMLAGLRSWWSGAVHAPFLTLHIAPTALVIGFLAGLAVTTTAILWSLRGLCRMPVRGLLAGGVSVGSFADPLPSRRSLIITALAIVPAVMLALAPTITDAMPEAPTFFGSGAALLVAALLMFNRVLRTRRGGVIRRGRWATIRLGIRNASRHPSRSVLTVGLIASATFVIAALQAFRVEPSADADDRGSGTGGFTSFAKSVVPIPYDLGTDAGRESLSIEPALLAGVEVIPLRLRVGEETSCLNLYDPTNPRILGATERFIERGGFSFAGTLADSDEERANPWRLLHRRFDDGAIPVIGDQSAVQWQLHSGLGKDFAITDERGQSVSLRFVALLGGSALQSELVIAEGDFTRLFPSISGDGFFMIAASQAKRATVRTALERSLEDFGLDVFSTTDRLADYLAVQNTYLLTFQTLGGFGLILGTIGMGAVLLRNVWERRGELALMRAVGFSTGKLATMVLAENALLVVIGLLVGVVSSILAVTPRLIADARSLPLGSVGLTLAGVLLVGMIAGAVAVIPTLRAPLLPALRRE